MIWKVLIDTSPAEQLPENVQTYHSRQYPELTDNGWMIVLLDGTVKYFEGEFIALPELGPGE